MTKIPCAQFSSHDCIHAMFGLGNLPENLRAKLDSTYLSQLLEKILSLPYLSPIFVARVVQSLLVFSQHQQALSPQFKQLVDALILPLAHFPADIQQGFKDKLGTLQQHCPAWHDYLQQQLRGEVAPVIPCEALASEESTSAPISQPSPRQQQPATTPRPKPRPAAARVAAPNNRIYQLISANDFSALETLLETKLDSLASIHRRVQQAQAKKLPPNAHQADGEKAADLLVTSFFNNSNSAQLCQLISKSNAKHFCLLIKACSLAKRFSLGRTNLLAPIIVYLPIDECTTFINFLVNKAQMYRDHRVVLNLIEALQIRRALEKDEDNKNEIKTLAINLMDRALDFHGLAHHHKVIEKLRRTLDKNQLFTLTISEGEEEGANSIVESSAPAQPQTTQTQTTTVPVNQANKQPVINSEYQYSSEDIQTILRLRLQEKNIADTAILASTDLNSTGLNSPAATIKQYLQAAQTTNRLHRALIPVLVNNNHWVELLLEINHKKITNISLFNSLKQNNQALAQHLNDQLLNKPNLAMPNLRVKPGAYCLEQDNSTDCGAFLVENFYCAVLNSQWPQTNNLGTTIRTRHLKLLREHDRPFHDQFYNRQKNNRNDVPALAKQMQSHGLFSSKDRDSSSNNAARNKQAPFTTNQRSVAAAAPNARLSLKSI
ncbi:hypothetical protein BN59_02811 [Legionella massiliensis]|uniref:Ubiquitin-like protease family profile domain-containing protein n=1 Tax=Legionella massiliensis TaxID=1034943 RepID=A0A078L045_9GAMM|nr:Ulp1 family isopeptidase [Legionella massiliensis]CDZ78501.1 hypothetical protein BN59_02811 [Legionella massiliensis]CEE14239.1 hypothetical protein BN1094_02811 [Legionella massiliensis]